MAGRRNLTAYTLYAYATGSQLNPPLDPLAATQLRRVATLRLPQAWAILGIQLVSSVYNDGTYPAGGFVVLNQDTDIYNVQSSNPDVPLSHYYIQGVSSYLQSQVSYSVKDGIVIGPDQPVSLYLSGVGTFTQLAVMATFNTYFISQ